MARRSKKVTISSDPATEAVISDEVGPILVEKPEVLASDLTEADGRRIEELAAEDCTVKEIACVIGCSKSTIYKYFGIYLEAGRERGNASLKRRMFEKAMSGNVPLLIWLSKQRLGYRDKFPEEEQNIQFNVFVKEVPS